MGFNLSIVTPDKTLENNIQVDEVVIPGEEGEMDVFEGHAPLLGTLSLGILKYKKSGETNFKKVTVSWGYCEISPSGVNILADTAETTEEIDKERAEIALKKSRQKLEQAGLIPSEEMLKWQRKEKRARTRLEAIK